MHLLVTHYMFACPGMGKGGMGGGGPGGLFNIGKSNAKKINKEMVTTSFKVLNCWSMHASIYLPAYLSF